MYEKICGFIAENRLIENGDRIVVGLSGGADSVSLLNVLHRLSKEMDIHLVAVHINHGIRGIEADQDEEFAKSLCRDLGIEFYSFSYDVKKLASEEGLSEEEAGRKLRYQAFYEVCKRLGCNKIAVAHNKNDNAETFLLNLFRGSGIKGLAGMQAKRAAVARENDNIEIIRPLLCVERREIEAYLLGEGLSYRTDLSNLSDDYSRNRIRNRVLSYVVDEINRQAIKNIHEASLKLQEAWDYIEDNIVLAYKKIVVPGEGEYRIPLDALINEAAIIQKGLVRHIIENMTGHTRDLEAKHIDAVLSLCRMQVGKQLNLPYGIIAEREYDAIIIRHKDSENRENSPIEPVDLKIPGCTPLPERKIAVITELFDYKKEMQIPKNCCIKWFDYDKIKNAVNIRTRREGDYLCINSSGGIKKLKNYFVDAKIPRKSRDSQLLIADGSHIMWLPEAGSRISEYYKVSENTRKILLIKLIEMEGDNYDRQNKSNDIGRTDREESQGAGRADQQRL